ncbi:MAG: SirB2 family protein [Wenzhouxiangella sp.]
MSIYILLKNLHIVLALISGIGFGLRGYIRLVLNRPLVNPMVRFGPHLVDTLLLLSGIALWVQMRYALLSWFGLKMMLVLVYIGLGIGAFRTRSRGTAIILYLGALITFVCIAAVALHKPALV